MSAGPERFLALYLNDHLAGATLGVELARRLRASNVDEPELAKPLAEICSEIEADRAILEKVMDGMEIRRGSVKRAAAWTGEKIARLKLNGQLRGYSPLSRLVELESLYIGITGKMQLWKALEQAFPRQSEFDFAGLAERAADQRRRVGELHSEAAARALPAEASPTEERSG